MTGKSQNKYNVFHQVILSANLRNAYDASIIVCLFESLTEKNINTLNSLTHICI